MTTKTEENVVEAKAREIVDNFANTSHWLKGFDEAYRSKLLSAIASALQAEREEEREECAKLVDNGSGLAGCVRAAAAIRNRSKSE